MSDKELIKQEIERLKTLVNRNESYGSGFIDSLLMIDGFIDNLQEEPASEDLEEAASKYVREDFHERSRADFKAGAEWQKQKNFEELFKSDMTLFKECYEKGRLDMREEMMKDAVDATILDVDAQTIEFGLWPEKLLDIKEGDKVKIIVIKEN